MPGITTISPTELAQRAQTDKVDVIDVRTPAEFRAVHVTIARNVPLESLRPQEVVAGRNGMSQQPLYVICQRGGRGQKACQQFIESGFANVVNVEGGTEAWEAAGLPVTRGKNAISLERQVRIAAGAIVLVGALLAIFVHPYFAGISAFVGAGLMFAGITDTCGMAMLLARMPWNQVSSGATCAVR